MKKLLLFLLLIVLFSISAKNSYSQRVLLNETFETSGMNTDSLPDKWLKFDEDLSSTQTAYNLAVWSVRDSGSFLQGVNGIVRSRAHTGSRGMSISWRAENPLAPPPNTDFADDWVFTDAVTVAQGDSLIFWMLMGTPLDIPSLTHYSDSMQIHVGPVQAPVATTRLASIVAIDSDNVWTQYKFNLSAFAGQTIYIAFRYYANTATTNGLFCNVDDVFIGNHSGVGVTPIGTNVPTEFALKQNYPNPFNPTTKIRFDIPKATNVRITVFNEVGQEVSVLQNGFLNAGFYETDFNGKNLASGTYFYRIEAGNFIQTKKLTLVK